MQRLKSAVLIVIASTALLAACDDGGSDDDLGIDQTTPSAATGATGTDGTDATGATSATGPTSIGTGASGATGSTGTDGTAVPGDDEETRIEASISESDITISPDSASGDVVLHVMNEGTTERDVLVVRMGADDDATTMFGLFEDDEVVDRASLDVVEEATVDADSETEIDTDLEAGNYVVLATTADGDGLLWAEFTVEEDMG